MKLHGRRSLRHPRGLPLRTPLLVPSVSSRGFGIRGSDGLSETQYALEYAVQNTPDVVLVSAYDLHYRHVAVRDFIAVEPPAVIVDSGGYEVYDAAFGDDRFRSPARPHPWTAEMLVEAVGSLPDGFRSWVVSFDDPAKPSSVSTQIEAARAQRHRLNLHGSCLLLKPSPSAGPYIQDALREIGALASEFGAFDAVGVVDKELAEPVYDRLFTVARIRLAMDAAGLKGQPIHVFGALDPQSCVAYFLAGADIFDGLNWMRLAFSDGRAHHSFGHHLLSTSGGLRSRAARDAIWAGNMHEMIATTYQMREFITDGVVTAFKSNAGLAQKVLDLLRSEFEGGS
jgi:hypothetical protein